MNIKAIVFVIAVALLSGCASQDVFLSENTLVLGEVTHVLTRDQVNAGNLGPNTKIENLSERIRAWGFTDQQVERDRIVVVRQGIYWNNVASGIKRDVLRPALIPEGMNVESGNIIEGAVGVPYTVVRVRARNMDDGKCRYDELPTGLAKGLMGAISLVGPSGAATLYCKGIETEGWQRPRSFWHKQPNGRYVEAANVALEGLPPTLSLSNASPATQRVSADAITSSSDLQPGKMFKDCTDCPEMVVIPGGNFMMGSGQDKVEQPIQSVTLKSFAAGRHAVTKVQFAAFVQAKGYVTEAEQGDGCLGWTGSTWKRDRMYNWRNVSFSQADDHPVVCVSWNDAKAYTQWISQVTAKQYRLLSESEREYATRAATTGKYWWGDTASRDHANYGTDQCCRPYEGKFTTPVGKYSANAFGLFDMSGNSWDWIEDWYHDNYNGAPTDGSAWISGGEQKYRVLRGGSWVNIPAGLRSSIRIGDTPGSRSGDIGFRLGRTLFTP